MNEYKDKNVQKKTKEEETNQMMTLYNPVPNKSTPIILPLHVFIAHNESHLSKSRKFAIPATAPLMVLHLLFSPTAQWRISLTFRQQFHPSPCTGLH